MFSLPGLDITGLAASLLTFPVGHAYYVSSSDLVRSRKSTRLQCFLRWNLVCEDDVNLTLKVQPSVYSRRIWTAACASGDTKGGRALRSGQHLRNTALVFRKLTEFHKT